jgi:deoxyribonuclease V
MIAAIDVAYRDRGSARAAAVVFEHFSDRVARAEYTVDISQVEAYVPGSFFRRELPCIMAVIEMIQEPISTVIIDGYVTLGRRPGLGFHLWQQLGQRIAVIGVAKSPFAGSRPVAVIRGLSRNPIYVTSAGIRTALAAKKIREMHGDYRIPTLLKHVDALSRGIAQKDGSRASRISGILKDRNRTRGPSD